MSLLKTDVVSALEKEGADALGIFKRTVERLTNTQRKIKLEKGIRVQKILELQKQQDALDSQEKRNSKLINKIEDFLKTDD